MLRRQDDTAQRLRQLFLSASDTALAEAVEILAPCARPPLDEADRQPSATSGNRFVSFPIFLLAMLLFIAFSTPLGLTTLHLNRGAESAEVRNMLLADLRVMFRCPHKTSELWLFLNRTSEFGMTPNEAAAAVYELSTYSDGPELSVGPEPFTPAWIAAVEKGTLDAVNEKRAENGMRPLIGHGNLELAARRHSEFMGSSGVFQHSLDPHGENILKIPVGYITHTRNGMPARRAPVGTPDETVVEAAEAWMGSPIHRKNILNSAYRWTGLGATVVDAPDGDGQLVLLTQRFSSREPTGGS